MSSDPTKVIALSSLASFAAGALSIWTIVNWRQRCEKSKITECEPTIVQPVRRPTPQPHQHSDEESGAQLHWNPFQERRGIGDLVIKANHIALIVSDVGRSLHFYVDILGLQQIRRPNFDRHGAWLTMGNLELHLIKGIPVPPPEDNLIVGHIALETTDVKLTLQKLIEMKVEFRQNISVPDPKTSRENRFEGGASKGPTGVVQYFFTDPDGYYIELCNCDILTDFCLNKERGSEALQYCEGVKKYHALTVAQIAMRWRRKARRQREEDLDLILEYLPRATEVHKERYENLCKRRFTYGDIMQGFSDEEIQEALLRGYNAVRLAIRLLTRQRGTERYFQPPSFYEKGELTKPKAFHMTKTKNNQ
ncbi:unnamed protein product [Adineta steineri]|uniref:VOC domain-containing protein n=1 Tax=Adineta steineri TaxID=433720 RepID=A0A814K192_9BILA|nr:unnamed protein product [Adineta steineri]CAF3478450.1 unnamed protein product [Adineta steineri]